MTGQEDLFTYREGALDLETLPDVDLTGFKVVALDGEAGKVDEATYDPGSSYLVVHTGFWSMKRVVLPGGLIDRIDVGDEKVYVKRTKDEIKNAPEIPLGSWTSENLRRDVAAYYGEETAEQGAADRVR